MAQTLTQLIADTRQLIGQTDEANSQFSNAQLTIWLNKGYRLACVAIRSVPVTTSDLAVTGATVTLDADFGSADFVRIKNPDNGNRYAWLDVITLPELMRMDPDYENADDGLPTHFVRTDTLTATLYPPPKASIIALTTPLRIQGVEMPTELSGSNDVPNLPSHIQDVLPNYAAFRCFLFLKDTASATQQITLFRGGLRDGKQLATEGSRQTRRMKWAERLD